MKIFQINRPRKKCAITTQDRAQIFKTLELSITECLLNESEHSLIIPTVDLSLIKISFSVSKVYTG